MRLIDANYAQHLANISLIAKNAQVVTWVLAKTPTIEAEPVKHGRWEKAANLKPKCSLCGEYHLFAWPDYKKCNYCPNCGAKMDLED